MKRQILSLLLLFPFFAVAQKDATALLDKVAAEIKADAALQMDYAYAVCDEEGEIVYSDNGTMKLDHERYSLSMDNMKVWCDGATQWSYMKDIDEVYITDANSDEAQNLSPLYIMEAYRENYTLMLDEQNETLAVVSLVAQDVEAEVNKIELWIDTRIARITCMFIYMPGQGHIEVMLGGYVPKCNFADDEYKCPVEEFPTAEVIDMR